jgi:hypothetical protein
MIDWRLSRVIRLETGEDLRSSKNSTEFFDCDNVRVEEPEGSSPASPHVP